MSTCRYNYTKLIVNYIPDAFTLKDIYNLFSPIGALSNYNIIMSGHKSLGYGFVEYYTPLHARIAIIKLNGLRVLNKTLKVDYSSFCKKGKLFVRNLRRDVTEEQVSEIFGQFGFIARITLLFDRITHRMYGIEGNPPIFTGKAFILYTTQQEALTAFINLRRRSAISSRKNLEVRIM